MFESVKHYNEVLLAAGGITYAYAISLAALDFYKRHYDYIEYKLMVKSFRKLQFVLYFPVLCYFLFLFITNKFFMAFVQSWGLKIGILLFGYAIMRLWIRLSYDKHSETDCKLWVDFISEYLDNNDFC